MPSTKASRIRQAKARRRDPATGRFLPREQAAQAESTDRAGQSDLVQTARNQQKRPLSDASIDEPSVDAPVHAPKRAKIDSSAASERQSQRKRSLLDENDDKPSDDAPVRASKRTKTDSGAASGRKLRPRTKVPQYFASRNSSRTEGAARAKPKDSVGQTEVESHVSAQRKRSLQDGEDDESSVATYHRAPKRTKTNSHDARHAAATGSQHEPRSQITNQAPTKKLRVFVYGHGKEGELGTGPTHEWDSGFRSPQANKYLDVDKPYTYHIVQLACKAFHTVALTADNKIVTWGHPEYGCLGRTSGDGNHMFTGFIDPEPDPHLTQEENRSRRWNQENPQYNNYTNVLLAKDYHRVPGAIPPGCFPEGTQFSQVAAGSYCSFALTKTGLVYGWGTLHAKELWWRNASRDFAEIQDREIPEPQDHPVQIQGLQNITQICCGWDHVMALDSDGNIWAWGCNSHLQTGRAPNVRTLTPQRVEVRFKAKYIACGIHHSFAIDSDDNVYGWGLNESYQAGHVKSDKKHDQQPVLPTKIEGLCQQQVTILDGGYSHSVAVTADGRCLAWGGISHLGYSYTDIRNSTLTRRDEQALCICPFLVPIPQVAYVACGMDYTIILDRAGKAYSSAVAESGELGECVSVMRLIEHEVVKDKHLTWAGAGRMYHIFAALAGSN